MVGMPRIEQGEVNMVYTPNQSPLPIRIGFCGKMASGKTTMATHLSSKLLLLTPPVRLGLRKISLASGVKEVATLVHGMKRNNKDRKLLQQIGKAHREIEPLAWVKCLLNRIEDSCWGGGWVIDDVRFLNEVKELKKEGFVIVKLDISDELQIERLKRTYGDDVSQHLQNRTDISESEIDEIPIELFDFSIEVCDGEEIFDEVYARLCELSAQYAVH